MNRLQRLSHNTALTGEEVMSELSGNIAGSSLPGHRAKRGSFSNYLQGGIYKTTGFSMKQGLQDPRVGEWTKLYIKGRGFFRVYDDSESKSYFTRLGDFHIDGEGNMVTKEGFFVIGKPLEGAFTHLRRRNVFNAASTSPVLNQAFLDNQGFSGAAHELNPAGQAIGNLDQLI